LKKSAADIHVLALCVYFSSELKVVNIFKDEDRFVVASLFNLHEQTSIQVCFPFFDYGVADERGLLLFKTYFLYRRHIENSVGQNAEDLVEKFCMIIITRCRK